MLSHLSPSVPVNSHIAPFIQRLIALLNATSLIWLYTDQTAVIVDALIIAQSDVDLSQIHHHQHYAHNVEVADDLRPWLAALPAGPDYVCMHIVADLATQLMRVQIEIAAFDVLLCRHVHIDLATADRLMNTAPIPSSAHIFVVAIVVRLVSATNRTVMVSHRTASGSGSRHQQAPCTESQFFAPSPSSLLVAMLRRETSVLAANRPIGATLTLRPPDCMLITTGDGRTRLAGRGVAMFRLLAERIGFELLLKCDDFINIQQQTLAKTMLSDFRMDFRERPWLKEFTVERVSL